MNQREKGDLHVAWKHCLIGRGRGYSPSPSLSEVTNDGAYKSTIFQHAFDRTHSFVKIYVIAFNLPYSLKCFLHILVINFLSLSFSFLAFFTLYLSLALSILSRFLSLCFTSTLIPCKVQKEIYFEKASHGCSYA